MKNKLKKNNMKLSPIKIVLIIVVINITLLFTNQKMKLKKLNDKKIASERELKIIQEEVKDLKKKIKKSNSVEYIEKIAREELKMVKPNEIIYMDRSKYED